MRPRHERRKQWIVNKPMQTRMALKMAVLPAAALVGIAAFTGLYCWSALQDARQLDPELPDLMPLIYAVLAVEVMAAGFLLVNSIRISHTVAGPAYRIQKSIERIRSGDLDFRVQLRKGDHLTEIRDELNLLLDWLGQNPPTPRREASDAAVDEPAGAAAGPSR